MATDDDVDLAFAFKKRSKKSSSRKRERSGLTEKEEGDQIDERIISKPLRHSEKKKRRRAWTFERNEVLGKFAERKDKATVGKDEVNLASESKKSKKPYGPMTAPANIRTTVRMDYQADICKDYKETGYCGFGDACKFLHDRSDFKAGWKLDRDWAASEKRRREKALRGEDPDEKSTDNDENDDGDGLPFACHICRNDFVNPVVTDCGHYFCEECAITRMQNNPTCPICNTALDGTLNVPTKLIAKLQSRSNSNE